MLCGVDLEVARGESVAIVGENGSGKSTLLDICAGVLRPDAGDVRRRDRTGFCPQQPGLVDLLTIDDHVRLTAAGTDDPRAAMRRTRSLLDELGVDAASPTIAAELSGGQRQKLNVALSLTNDPHLVLLDEPYQGFDHGSYLSLWDVIRRWTCEGRSVAGDHAPARRERPRGQGADAAGRGAPMNPRRTMAVCRAHARELSRRKLAILLLLGLPLAFYFLAGDDGLAISFATVGFGWSIAIMSLFSTQSVRAITPRLALVGFRPVEIVAGRVLSIACYGAVIGTLLFSFLQADKVVRSPSHLAWSLGFAVVGSCTAGLAVGAISDRETETMLFLIGLVSLTLVAPSASTLARLLPMFATDEYAWAAVEGGLRSGHQPWKATALVSTVLGLIAVVSALRRLPRVGWRRLRIPGRPLRSG